MWWFCLRDTWFPGAYVVGAIENRSNFCGPFDHSLRIFLLDHKVIMNDFPVIFVCLMNIKRGLVFETAMPRVMRQDQEVAVLTDICRLTEIKLVICLYCLDEDGSRRASHIMATVAFQTLRVWFEQWIVIQNEDLTDFVICDICKILRVIKLTELRLIKPEESEPVPGLFTEAALPFFI